MKLYFVRHGEAEDLAPTDHSRALTERGIERTQIAAQVLRRIGIQPNVIYSSPRVRAKQTAEIIADALNMEIVITEDVNFGFDLTHIKNLTKDLKSGDEAMFVGHNPDMSQVVHKLSGASVAMKKGGFARIDVMNNKTQRGELVWLLAPKIFDSLHNTPEGTDIAQILEESVSQEAGDSDDE